MEGRSLCVTCRVTKWYEAPSMKQVLLYDGDVEGIGVEFPDRTVAIWWVNSEAGVSIGEVDELGSWIGEDGVVVRE